MARKGWFILSLLLFLLATTITLYKGIPFLISKSLGKRVYYTGYKFSPWWNISFQKFEAESLFYVRNLSIDFKLFPFIRNRMIERLSADSMVIMIKRRNATPQVSSDFDFTLGFGAIPLLVKELKVGTMKFITEKHVLNMDSIHVKTQPWETYWKLTVFIDAVTLDSIPPHEFKAFATLHTDKVFLEGMQLKGPSIYLVTEGQTIGSVIKLRIDTLNLLSRIVTSKTDLIIDLNRKSIFLNASKIDLDTFSFNEVKLRARDQDTTIVIEQLVLSYKGLYVSGEGVYSKPHETSKAEIILRGRWRDVLLHKATIFMEGEPNNLHGKILVSKGKYRDLTIRGFYIDFYTVGRESVVVKSFSSEQPFLKGNVTLSKGKVKLNAEVERIDISKLIPGIKTLLSMEIVLEGPIRKPSVSGTLLLSELNLKNIKAETGFVNVLGTPDSLQLFAGIPNLKILNQLAENTEVSILRRSTESTFVVSTRSGMLEEVRIKGKVVPTEGGINIRADTILIRSSELNREWVGNLTINQTKGGTWFTINARDVRGGTLKVLGGLNMGAELTVQMVDFDLTGLPLPRPFDGKASMTLNLRGELNKPEIRYIVNWEGSVFAGAPMDSVSIKGQFANDSLVLETSRFSVGESEIRLGGVLQIKPNQITKPSHFFNAPIDINITAWNWSITNLFNSISTDYYTDSMSFIGDVKITGTLRSPQFSGIVEVGGGPVALLPASTVFQSLFARGTVENNRITFKQAKAISPGISVTGTGYVTLSGFNLDTVNLMLNLKNFELKPQPGVEAWLNGSLAVKGKFPRLYIDGELEISKGYITLPFGKRPAVQQVEAPSPIRYRIHLTADDRLYFINDVLQTEFQCDITITKDSDIGSNYSGVLTALGGSFWYLDRGFRITEGKLVFNQSVSLNPDIDFKAEYLIQDSIMVMLSAIGTLQEPQVNLVSTPPMPLEDIVSLLAFGRRVSELSPSLTELSYIRARSLNLAEALLSKELKQRLRLTELEIATGLAGRDPHFTVGFYLSPRIRLRYTHDIKSPIKDVFLLNYYLMRGIGIYVERDRDGRLGGGLNFRFRF